MGLWMDEWPKNKPSQGCSLTPRLTKEMKLVWCHNCMIKSWVYTSLILLLCVWTLLRSLLCVWPLLCVWTLLRKLTCCDTWREEILLLDKMESQGLGFTLPLETSGKKKKNTKKYGFQTLHIRPYRTVIPKMRKQIRLALLVPHLITLRKFSGCRTGRKYQYSPWLC